MTSLPNSRTQLLRLMSPNLHVKTQNQYFFREQLCTIFKKTSQVGLVFLLTESILNLKD